MMNNQGLPPVGGNDSRNVQADEQQRGQNTVDPQIVYIRESAGTKQKSGFKWFVLTVAVLVIVGFAIWMTQIGGVLTSVQHGVAQNSAQLQNNHNMLVQMQQQLQSMNAQIAQLGNELRTYMTNLIQLLHH